MNKKFFTILFTGLLGTVFTNLTAQTGKVTNEQIYREIIEIKKGIIELKFKDEQILKKLEVFEAKTDERFVAIDQRFEAIDQRFEAIDQRFEAIDQRFEHLEKIVFSKFDDLTTFMWILSSIFTPLMISFLVFLFWDRQTIIDTSVKKAVEKIESKEGMLIRLVNAFKELAKKNKEVAAVLRQFNLL